MKGKMKMLMKEKMLQSNTKIWGSSYESDKARRVTRTKIDKGRKLQ